MADPGERSRDPSRPLAAAAETAAPAEHLDFLWKTQTYLNEHIRLADAKAGFAIALESAIAGGLFTANAHKVLVTAAPGGWGPLGWLSLIAFLLMGVSILSGIWTVHPRFAARRKGGLIFWREILRHGSAAKFDAAVRSHSVEELAKHLSQHAYALSQTCHAKFQCLSICMGTGLAGASIGVAVMLLGE